MWVAHLAYEDVLVLVEVVGDVGLHPDEELVVDLGEGAA